MKRYHNLFLLPVATIATVATISSCSLKNCEHEFGIHYAIINDHLYNVCEKCGEKEYIPDSELTQFNNKFLVKDGQYWIISEATSMKQVVADVPEGGTIDIYFCGGTYIVEEGINNITVNIHGIRNQNNERITTIDGGSESIHQVLNLDLNIDCAIIKGNTTHANFYEVGLWPKSLNCTNCYLYGMNTVWRYNAKYDSCTFDTTMLEYGPTTAEYGIDTYGCPDEIWITNCRFLTQGKAIKIYGQSGNHTMNIHLENIWMFAEEPRTTKYAIEIDSTEASLTGDKYWNVYIKNCICDKGFTGLYNPNIETEQPHVKIFQS